MFSPRASYFFVIDSFLEPISRCLALFILGSSCFGSPNPFFFVCFLTCMPVLCFCLYTQSCKFYRSFEINPLFMFLLNIEASKLPRTDLKSGPHHRNDLSVYLSALACLSKTKKILYIQKELANFASAGFFELFKCTINVPRVFYLT